MKSQTSSNRHLYAIIALTVLTSGLGWHLHKTTELASSESNSNSDSPSPAISSLTKGTSMQSGHEFKERCFGDYRILQDGQRIYNGPRDTSIMERFARIRENDTRSVVEIMGQLSQMNTAELESAWLEMSQQAPRDGFYSQLLALYVRQRLEAVGIEIELPGGWALAEVEFSNMIAIDRVRRDPEFYLGKLERGEELSQFERETLLLNLSKNDSVAATKLWLEHSDSVQLQKEVYEMASLMKDPQSRALLMEHLDSMEADSIKGNLLSTLTEEWILNEPENVESWLATVSDPFVREVVSENLLAFKINTDPINGLAYSQSLTGNLRQTGISRSAYSLAETDWEKGEEVLATISNPEDRKAAVIGFGYVQARDRYEEFERWRADLSPVEQNFANQEAFAYFAKNDVNEAIAWLNEQPDGQPVEYMKSQLMEVYTKEHPESMLDLLATFEDPMTKRNAAAIALRSLDPTDLEGIGEVLRVANDRSSGVNIVLPEGAVAAPLPPSREGTHDGCEHCAH